MYHSIEVSIVFFNNKEGHCVESIKRKDMHKHRIKLFTLFLRLTFMA